MPQAWQVVLRVWITRCLLRVCGAWVYLLAAADRRCPETRFAVRWAERRDLMFEIPTRGQGGFANPNPEILALPLAANGNVTPALQTALQAASQAPRKLPSTPPPLPTLGSFNQPERACLIIAHRGFGRPEVSLAHCTIFFHLHLAWPEQSSLSSDCDCSHPYSLRWPRG